jgi:replicative DNA helicase
MKNKTDNIQLVLPGLEWEEGPGPLSAKDVIKDAFREIERIYESGDDKPPRGLPLGFAELDRWIVGLKGSEMTVIGSRPGIGKTLFSLHVAFHAAEKFSVPVLIFSPESRRTKLIMRMLSFVGRVPANRIITGDLGEQDWPKLTTAAGRLSDASLFIDDSPDLTVPEIKRKAMRIRDHAGLGLIIIDSLDSMRLSRMTTDSETDHLERARSLKNIARTLHVPLILTANFDRGFLSKADRMPTPSDLLDQHIEIFADLILLLHREKMAVHADKQKTDRVLLDVNIAKNRNGPTGRVRLILDRQYLNLTEQDQASILV